LCTSTAAKLVLLITKTRKMTLSRSIYLKICCIAHTPLMVIFFFTACRSDFLTTLDE
jgi:hypothetical protein